MTGADYPDVSRALNDGKRDHTHEYASFHELFLNEIAGCIDVFKDEITDTFNYLYESETGNTLTDEEKLASKEKRNTRNMIYHSFRLNKVKQYLP